MDSESSLGTARTRSRTPTTSLRAFSPFSINRREHAAAAAAASASEEHAPPTFPPSFSADTREGAMTSEDDIKSIPALDAVSDAAEDDDVEFDGGFSMRSFTAARFKDINSLVWGPNTELETKNATAKMDNADRRKKGGPSGSSVPGIDVKADEIKIFTGYGAYSAREERLKREEEEGRLKFVWVSNDGVDQHMIWLIGLKNIFAKQLPKMPKKQIVRLVMDRSHKSVIVIKYNKVVGGITYRPFASQKFGEIAFGAIRADEQAKGYGMRMMNHLKQYARDVDGLTHFLTYADNTAIGYFVKQGFTGEISLEKDQWHGYIKDYDGGILMECKIEPNVQFTDLSTLIHLQMQAIEEKVRELAHFDIVYPGIDFEKKEAGIPEKFMKVEDIPGLIETGWTPEQWGKSGYRTLNPSTDRASNQKFVTEFMCSLLKSMHDHADAWPFKEPVDVREVPDYYEIIEDPMDLTTMSKRVESGKYYSTLEMFLADAKRMFANAHNYNAPETKYYKCATRLNTHFQSQVQLGLESASIKIQQQ